MEYQNYQDIAGKTEYPNPSALTDLEPRPIEIITNEIIFYKQMAGSAIVEIGQRLTEAKRQLMHGEWLPWLEEKVQFSEASAQRFMRLAKEYSNPSALTDLGVSKALSLLALPATEREEFAAEKHEVNGEEKSIDEMTTRELEQAIKERNTAREEAESWRLKSVKAEEAEKALRKEADRQIEELDKRIDELSAEIQKLNERPLEVTAIETVADKEAEAVLQAKIDELVKAQEEEKAKYEAKLAKLKAAKEKAEEAKDKAAEEVKALKLVETQNEDLKKQLALSSSTDLSEFRVNFDQAQCCINNMKNSLTKLQESDPESACKLREALKALLSRAFDTVKECGEDDPLDEPHRRATAISNRSM